MTLVLAWSLGSTPLAADAIYDVGSNTTFATFNAALSQAYADQSGPFGVTARVRVLDSTYNGNLDLDGGLLPLQPQPGAGLIIESGPVYGGATLSGAGSYGIRVHGVDHVTLRGLSVQGFSVSSAKLSEAGNAVLDSLSLYGAGASALDAADCVTLTVRNSLLAPSAGTGALLDRCDALTLQGNTVQGGPSYGLVAQNSRGVLMDGNRADGSNYAFNAFSSTGVTLSANVSIGRGKKRGMVLDSSFGSLILKNLLVGQEVGLELQGSTTCAVYQNTVWEHSTAALYANAGSDNLTLKNNLWQGFIAYFLNSTVQSSLSSDHNGFRFAGKLATGSGSYDDLGSWQSAGFDLNSREADPVFQGIVGTEPDAFKLQLSSPMLGYGDDLSAITTVDFFGNTLAPAPSPWDPGIHVASVPQAVPTLAPTATPAPPPPTPTPTASPTVTSTLTPSPIGTATPSPSPSLTPTITSTYTVTPYPYQRDRAITYPNPWSPAGPPLNIVFEPGSSATIRLFDMAGELVLELPSANLRPDLGHATWDGRDRNGARVPSGLYFCVVNTPKGVRFTRFTVLY